MNTYHISYAAHPGTKKAYIRGRRYMPEKQGLNGTELKPDYSTPKLFATGVKHHITVIKQDRYLYMRVENPDQVAYFHMFNLGLARDQRRTHWTAPYVYTFGSLREFSR
jgi:hypothetical protein